MINLLWHNLIQFLFPNRLPEGAIPIKVLYKDENKKIDIVKGYRILKHEHGFLNVYTPTNGGSEEAFYTAKGTSLGELEGTPLYTHRTGECFGAQTQGYISSQYLYQIVKSNVGIDMIQYQRTYEPEGKKLNWKKIIIAIAIIGAVLYAWQAGYIESLIKDIIPSSKEAALCLPIISKFRD